MPADVFRLFIFARHAGSAANAANMLNSSRGQLRRVLPGDLEPGAPG
jgi:hypothetical protein